ncbi:MAG: DUF3179 domain-containing protein [Cyanobacteria bacterium J06638_28]
MGRTFKLTGLIVLGALLISLVGLAVHAGSWDNFKLRYGFLTQFLHNQNQELSDLQDRSLDPAANTRIELAQLLNGGPPKDGIPSIDNPQFDSVAASPFPAEADALGLVINDEAVAYPLGILNWHEIVNDTVGGENVSVTYCPLCDTAIAFARGSTTFGVSGKLFQSCLVMFDRTDNSLYAQPWGIGIVGAQVNQSLDRYPMVKTTLGAWAQQHPDTKVLGTNTGHERDYFRYPYGTYLTDERVIFPVRYQADLASHPKAGVTYIWSTDSAAPLNYFSGDSHQFIHEDLQTEGEQWVEFDGRRVRAYWDADLATAIVTETDGQPIPSSPAFAFVYPAFFTAEPATQRPPN